MTTTPGSRDREEPHPTPPPSPPLQELSVNTSPPPAAPPPLPPLTVEAPRTNSLENPLPIPLGRACCTASDRDLSRARRSIPRAAATRRQCRAHRPAASQRRAALLPSRKAAEDILLAERASAVAAHLRWRGVGGGGSNVRTLLTCVGIIEKSLVLGFCFLREGAAHVSHSKIGNEKTPSPLDETRADAKYVAAWTQHWVRYKPSHKYYTAVTSKIFWFLVGSLRSTVLRFFLTRASKIETSQFRIREDCSQSAAPGDG